MQTWVCALVLAVPCQAEVGDKKEEKKPVSGVFKGNGRDAKVAHASAHKGDLLGEEPTVVLLFTEQDHSKEKNRG